MKTEDSIFLQALNKKPLSTPPIWYMRQAGRYVQDHSRFQESLQLLHAVGDITGFCAASYLRGIDFIQIPTTLLAQVDSSVGGKTAINIKQGKNLVGAFYNPTLVLISTKFLETLSDKEYKSGLGEVAKYAFIGNKRLYKFMQINAENIKLKSREIRNNRSGLIQAFS